MGNINKLEFYKLVVKISIPVMIQYLIMDLAGILDSVMVGRLTLEQVTGVTIAAQIISVISSSMSGCTVSASIYESQYYSKGDNDGIQQVIRYKIFCSLLIYVCVGLIIGVYSEELIKLFIHDETCDIIQVISCGKNYMWIIYAGLLFYLMAQVCMSTLVDVGNTKIPFITSFIAIGYNLIANYLLIFGKLGFPALGSKGAAIATATSHIVEISIVGIYLLTHKKQYPFLKGLFKSLKISKQLLLNITKNGVILIASGLTWNIGNTLLVQNYSMCGVSAVLAVTISFGFINMLRCFMSSFGETIVVILGRYLGSKTKEETLEANNLLIKCSFLLSLFLMCIGFVASFIYPKFYNVPNDAKSLIQYCLIFYSSMFIFNCLDQVSYYTLTAGGKTVESLKYDSGFIFAVYVPLSFVLTRFTSLDFKTIFFTVQIFEVLKCYLIFHEMRKNEWLVSSV